MCVCMCTYEHTFSHNHSYNTALLYFKLLENQKHFKMLLYNDINW
jgi:hypothetical protein